MLNATLSDLYRLPGLHSVLVVWNNVDRPPSGPWPQLHVPLIFVRPQRNSLNNRFFPYAQIRTEAVLMLDDDIDLKHHEIVFAFKSVWRENRDRIVGFPARYHARYTSTMMADENKEQQMSLNSPLFYNSNHTCQFSMVLTGAAFLHKVSECGGDLRSI